MKQGNIYTVNQMASITGFSTWTIYDKITKLKLVPEITKQKVNYYDEVSFNILLKALEHSPKEKSFTKYYPMKTTETFHIYESKMNI